MSNPAYNKKSTDAPIWEGPRVAQGNDFVNIDDLDKMNLQIIYDAMDGLELITFKYDGHDRVVAPFVIGVSSRGNPLLRGYQLEGNSRSGKGEGWRVFQVRKMEMVDRYWEFFNKKDFKFDEVYPWTYKVLKML